MKIRISAFLFLLSMICVSVLNAQSSDWLWAKTFGGPNSNRINKTFAHNPQGLVKK